MRASDLDVATPRNRRATTHRSPARGRSPRTAKAEESFGRLVSLMAALRSPTRGCAWDLRQTHRSLRSYLLEETYEAVEAIDHDDMAALRGELGDVLLQCVFHAQLAAEARRFDIADVIDGLAAKLIRRHPHVFTAAGRLLPTDAPARRAARSANAVREQWAVLKARERGATGESPRVLAGVPRALPALVRAQKIAGRVATVGFDWRHPADVFAKIEEELIELRSAIDERPPRTEEELGDLLFAVTNLARKLGLDAEQALQAANDKFVRRFDAVEAAFEQRGTTVHSATLEALEAAWDRVKADEAVAPRPADAPTRSTSTRGRARRRKQSSARRPGPS